MNQLYQELSRTDMSKNTGNKDRIKLDEFYTRWILQISDVVTLITNIIELS